jgi:hypothetical protein
MLEILPALSVCLPAYLPAGRPAGVTAVYAVPFRRPFRRFRPPLPVCPCPSEPPGGPSWCADREEGAATAARVSQRSELSSGETVIGDAGNANDVSSSPSQQSGVQQGGRDPMCGLPYRDQMSYRHAG